MSANGRAGVILVLGHSCLDSIAITDRPAREDGKREALRIWSGVGGPAANAAIALRRLGHEVRLATRVGGDPAGNLVRQTLEAEGVELLLPAVESGTTSLAQIRSVGAARSVLWRRGDLPGLGEVAPMWLDGADLLYLDGHEIAAATQALRLAEVAAIPVVHDPGSFRRGSENWLPSLQSAVATPRWLRERFPSSRSIDEALGMLSESLPEGAVAGITLGACGGFARRGGEDLSWRPRKVGVVDTTGAGDAFHAGLADALLQGMETRAGLDWAATLAASVCRSPGNRSLPRDRDQLALWHGRWGFREGPPPSVLGEPIPGSDGSGPAQGTATI